MQFQSHFFRTVLMPILLVCSSGVFGQHDKILFVKEVPIKLKAEYNYTFYIGYEATRDRDIAVEISGGTAKYWSGGVETVKKGKGVLTFKVNSDKKPKPGEGFRILASMREKGGDWTTNVASAVINNVQMTKDVAAVSDDANFDLLTPTILSSSEVINFKINYKASQTQLLTVAVWKKNQWLGASPPTEVTKGKGIKEISVNIPLQKEGKDYRYVLYYGNGEGFPDKNLTSKEISGVEFTAFEKVLTIKELNERSIIISLNKDSNILTLPGDISYDFIKIIALNGEIIKEKLNTNSIPLSDISRGAYYAISSKDDYYKFIKF